MTRQVSCVLALLLAMVALSGRNVAGQSGSSAPRTPSNDEQAVRKAETDRFAAMVKADVGTLDRLLGADLTYTHGDGRVIDKAAFLSDFKTGAFKYVTIDPNDIHVRLFGDVAVVTGGSAMQVVNNGAPASIKIRYTDVQVK